MQRMQRTAVSAALLLLLLAGMVRGAQAQTPGNCSLGTAEADLNINNVFGRVFNTGSLFYGNTTTNGDGYYVPKAAQRSPVYASGVWIGGKVDGDLRLAGARYSNFNFWPGPLDATGQPINNCVGYDRIYKVSKSDIQAYEGGASPARDLAEWPVNLGAPVVDGDGNPSNYDLAAGDRPEILGDQALWWVMNDVGNDHAGSGAPPLGVEVQVLAWAFSRADAIGNTTFYRYRVINKGSSPIEDTYLSLFSDPDLGNASDDYVGFDQELSMGYVYNSDNDDEGAVGYGVPPAMGYDFFQGPINAAGDTLGATAFSYFINGSPGTTTGDPSLAPIMYNFMQGLWGDGSEMRASGTGYQQPNTSPITTFAFPGDPVAGEAWTELNNGTSTPVNPQGDRRFLVSTGPFILEPNVPQDIVFGIVFAQGGSNLASITALRAADRLAQQAYDIDFQLAPPPPAPPACKPVVAGTTPGPNDLVPGSGRCAEAVAQDGKLTLVWGYPRTSENYLGQFEVVDQLLAGQPVSDSTYNFEGFNIYRYPTSSFQSDQAELIATFDEINGVQTVRDEVFDPEAGVNNIAVTARGTDSGIQYSLEITGLTNFRDYYYGITAYAYNEESSPKINESSPTLLVGRPAGLPGGLQERSVYGDSVSVQAVEQRGGGQVRARVVDPTALTGDDYRVEFFQTADGRTSYNVINVATQDTVANGRDYFARTGETLRQDADVVVADGISFSIAGPDPDIRTLSDGSYAWVQVQTPSGNPPCVEGATDLGCVELNPPADLVYHALNYGPPNNGSRIFVSEGSASSPGSEQNIGLYTPNDFEIRFTQAGGLAAYAFQAPYNVIRVPFEVWDIGPTGTAVNDPSDDVRLIPYLNAPNGGTCAFDVEGTDAAFGLPASDWIYAYYPTTTYSAFETAFAPSVAAAPGNCFPAGTQSAILSAFAGGTRPIQRQVIGDYDGDGVVAATGTTIRVLTTKPNLPGDEFLISTKDINVEEPSEDAQLAALEQIQVVPNPYMGASNYETGNSSHVVRFTNLPAGTATIRVYTIAGTLVKSLTRTGDSRTLDWDLTTQSGLPVASGMYLIHVDIEGVGERVLKFGVVQRQTVIDVF